MLFSSKIARTKTRLHLQYDPRQTGAMVTTLSSSPTQSFHWTCFDRIWRPPNQVHQYWHDYKAPFTTVQRNLSLKRRSFSVLLRSLVSDLNDISVFHISIQGNYA